MQGTVNSILMAIFPLRRATGKVWICAGQRCSRVHARVCHCKQHAKARSCAHANVFSCPCKCVSLQAACGGKILCSCKYVFTASSRQSRCCVRAWCTQASMSETKRRGSCACISIGRGMPPGPPRVNAPMNLQVPSSGIIRQSFYLEQHFSRVSCQRRALCPL